MKSTPSIVCKNLSYLGGTWGSVPHQMLLTCPWNGALSVYYISGSALLEEGRRIWNFFGEGIIFVCAGQNPVLTSSERPLCMLNIVIGGCDDISLIAENSTSVFLPKLECNESLLKLFSNLVEQLPCEREHILLGDFFSKLFTEIQLLAPNGICPPDSIVLMKKIFDTRYVEKLTLDKIAGELHWNKYKLEKDFKKCYSCSPFEYLLNVRIQAACRLLCQTNRSILDIGLAVGIENTSYFIRIFKRQTGMSPQEYRTHHTGRSKSECLETR